MAAVAEQLLAYQYPGVGGWLRAYTYRGVALLQRRPLGPVAVGQPVVPALPNPLDCRAVGPAAPRQLGVERPFRADVRSLARVVPPERPWQPGMLGLVDGPSVAWAVGAVVGALHRRACHGLAVQAVTLWPVQRRRRAMVAYSYWYCWPRGF